MSKVLYTIELAHKGNGPKANIIFRLFIIFYLKKKLIGGVSFMNKTKGQWNILKSCLT